jgi:hypothetical protein
MRVKKVDALKVLNWMLTDGVEVINAEPGYSELRYNGWRIRVLSHIGEVHICLSTFFDRWANSRQYTCRLPKNKKEARRLLAFLDKDCHVKSGSFSYGYDDSERYVDHVLSRRYHRERTFVRKQGRSKKTRRRGK